MGGGSADNGFLFFTAEDAEDAEELRLQKLFFFDELGR